MLFHYPNTRMLNAYIDDPEKRKKLDDYLNQQGWFIDAGTLIDIKAENHLVPDGHAPAFWWTEERIPISYEHLPVIRFTFESYDGYAHIDISPKHDFVRYWEIVEALDSSLLSDWTRKTIAVRNNPDLVKCDICGGSYERQDIVNVNIPLGDTRHNVKVSTSVYRCKKCIERIKNWYIEVYSKECNPS